MVGRKIKGGADGKGLCQWSFVQLAGRDQRKVMLLSTYKPCKQLDEGDSTATAQQKRLLTMQGNRIDANSNIDKMELCKFVVKATLLYDLMEVAVDPTEKVGMLAFNAGIDSDHCAFVLDINQYHLLRGNEHQIA
eukprot:12750153-Ditylum_brightwellii.AAC.1